MMTLSLLPLCSSKSHKYNNHVKGTYMVSSYSQSIHLPSGPHRHTDKHVLNCTFSKSLTNNYSNLIEPYNQGINLRITTKDIKKEDRLCIESPPPDTFFQIHPYVFRVNFSNNISIPLVRFIIRETEHDTAFEISSLLTLRINPFKILQNGQSSFFK